MSQVWNQFVENAFRANGVPRINGSMNSYEISSSQVIKMYAHIQEHSEFLKRIRYESSPTLEGFLKEISITKMLSKRTDFQSIETRSPRTDIHNINDLSYKLEKVERDFSITYRFLDEHMQYNEFVSLYQKMVGQQIAKEIVNIGWYGETAATVTKNAQDQSENDATDILPGWIADLKSTHPANVINRLGVGDKKNEDAVFVGAEGDYRSLDEMISAAVDQIPTLYQDGLIAFIGHNLFTFHKAGMHRNNANDASKKIFISQVLSNIGGLPVETPPGFLDSGIVIVNPYNLAFIYAKKGARRALKDNPNKDQYEDYRTTQEAYKVVNKQAMLVIPKVTLLEDVAITEMQG